MSMFKGIITTASVLVLTACEKIIEPKDLPQQDPLIVVNSLIRTDESISAQISQSKSILSGKDYKYITNAVCELYEDGNYVQNLVYSSNGMYQAVFFPKAGKSYEFRVSAPGFTTATASTRVPVDLSVLPVDIIDTSMHYRISNYGPGGTNFVNGEVKFRVRLIDEASVKNYYGIEPIVVLLDSMQQPIKTATNVTVINYGNTTALSGQEYFDKSMEFDDDGLVNGNQVQRNIGVQFSADEDPDDPRAKYVVVYFNIQNLSTDYFQYKQTVINQAFAGPNLFAEPVQVYCNVKDGLGIFAGINSTQVTAYSGQLRKD